MRLINFLIVGLFVNISVARADVSNAEGAGQCYGITFIGMNDYRIKPDDWDENVKKIFKKYTPTFQKVQPAIISCIAGDNSMKKLNDCIAKLPGKFDQDFYIGLNAGVNASDNAFKNGGVSQVKMTASITCNGIK